MAAITAPKSPLATLPPWRRFFVRLFAVVGPGLIVAFADTEAGSVTTAASSGAQFGMKLVLLQLLLIVPLYVVQEMTVRLGTATGKGHAQLIRENYGSFWCWVSLGTMLITNLAALVTEFIGIAGAALIFGVNPALMIVAAAAVLIAVSLTGAYRRAEVIALGLCLLELLFIPAAFAAHPSAGSIVRDGIFGSQPLGDRTYLLLVASNIGAVIMPWMIFYQQSATVDKGLKLRDLKYARIDTAFGAIATQVIMISIVVTTAATLYVRHVSVSDAAHAALALIPLTGRASGIVFGAGLIGAAMLGAFVVSLATSWAFGEAFGWPSSLNLRFGQAKRFYGLYACIVVAAAAIVLVPNLPLVRITLYVEAGNALVLPLVLGFLLVMANDKKILGDRCNSLVGNIVAVGISAICIGLGIWYAALTFMGLS
ncbi:MAG: divalent metal cation transporter [Candidatus Eremiobacteraeota bacterium]|nr:divalent metal cation transporter [Candidatus Eremiobacteraeota bacterium]